MKQEFRQKIISNYIFLFLSIKSRINNGLSLSLGKSFFPEKRRNKKRENLIRSNNLASIFQAKLTILKMEYKKAGNTSFHK